MSLPSPLARKPFFRNRYIEQFAAKPSTPISLKHLINFGKHGRNKGEKEEAEKLIKGGNFLRTELPTRLSHRLRDLQELPFIVTSHPRMENVYSLYEQAFEGIRKFPLIKDLDDNDNFCAFMQSTLDVHRVIIPELALGIAEASPAQLSPSNLDTFMTRMLRSRISRRVITEQHIALTSQFRERQQAGKRRQLPDEDRRVGVVDTALNAAQVVRKCAELVKIRGGPEATIPVQVDGELDTNFAYIPEHLEFMVFELIKTAGERIVQYHGAEDAKNHPLLVTIVHGPRDLAIRVSDQGGGIPPYGGLEPDTIPRELIHNAPRIAVTLRTDIFSFSHMRRLYLHHQAQELANIAAGREPKPKTGIMALRELPRLEGTVQEQLAQMRTFEEGAAGREEEAALMDAQSKSGIGLPLAKMFAEYFSGTLEIYTMMGQGSDATLKIPKFGDAP